MAKLPEALQGLRRIQVPTLHLIFRLLEMLRARHGEPAAPVQPSPRARQRPGASALPAEASMLPWTELRGAGCYEDYQN